MREDPASYNEAVLGGKLAGQPYPGGSLRRFSYHTGASLRPLKPDEPCPVLFRDLGPVALARFLRGQLRRLAGPLSPIIYMRDHRYVEPYVDHARIGRILFLRPLALAPWHSGVDTILVAAVSHPVDPGHTVFVPGEMPLEEAARLAEDLRNADEWREVLGGPRLDEARAETLLHLDGLAESLARTEEHAAPLRSCLQASNAGLRDRARAELVRLGLTENDLCAAWHHLPRQRRDLLEGVLPGVDPALVAELEDGECRRITR